MENFPKPTQAELAILQVLWQRGPSTVREVYQVLNAAKKTGYTTVLKFMQIMLEKGLVGRDNGPYAHVYTARLPKEQAQGTLLAELLEGAFEGSVAGLVMRALSTKKATPKELSEIRTILKNYERGAK